MALKVLSHLALLVGTGAMELTSSNWDEMSGGKAVFIKFQAPW
jgi:hypothetical protein